jgi:hypothetical protein
MNGSDRFGVSGAALRPGKHSGGNVRGGAITGVRESSIPSTIRRLEGTGME